MECPEIRELAAFVETETAPATIAQHIVACDACQEAIATLRDEVQSLQIPLSEIWFRERLSCLHLDVLGDYRTGRLDPEFQDYVKFHVEELECTFCQARLGEAELAANKDLKRNITRSRKRVLDAAAVLRDELRKTSPA